MLAGVRAGVATEVAPRHWELRWQLGCLTPVRFHYVGRRSRRKATKPMLVDELVPCRKCEACVKSRARMWFARAMDEFDHAARTWLGTFTMSPGEHAQLDVQIALRNGNRVLSQEELLRERTGEFGKHVTAWLKRVRSASFERTGVSRTMRYLVVAEVHDSEETDPWMRGRPHFHMLLHEGFCGAVVEGDPSVALAALRDAEDAGVPKPLGFSGEMIAKKVERRGKCVDAIFATDQSLIKQQWQLGYTVFELCFDSNAASYPCKYLMKSAMWRVRPSLKYGRLPEAVAGVSPAWPIAEAIGERGVDPSDVNIGPPKAG